VYAFVAPRQKRAICPVYATKGSSQRGRPIIAGRQSKPNKYRVRVFPIGTDTAKDVVFPRLKLERATDGSFPPGFMHIPRPLEGGGCDDEFLAQFGREKVVVKYSHGVPYRVYEVSPKGARNEAVDLEVGNLHMLHLLGASVYDQLSVWVGRVQADGARNRATAATRAPASSTAEAPRPIAVPRRPPPRPGGGYINSWRR